MAVTDRLPAISENPANDRYPPFVTNLGAIDEGGPLLPIDVAVANGSYVKCMTRCGGVDQGDNPEQDYSKKTAQRP